MARSLAELEQDRDNILNEMATLVKQPGVDSSEGLRAAYREKMTVLEKSLAAVEAQIRRLKGPSKISLEGIDG